MPAAFRPVSSWSRVIGGQARFGGQISASGDFAGVRMRTRFFREDVPDSTVTADFPTPKDLARKAMRCAFALPATGAAVMATR